MESTCAVCRLGPNPLSLRVRASMCALALGRITARLSPNRHYKASCPVQSAKNGFCLEKSGRKWKGLIQLGRLHPVKGHP